MILGKIDFGCCFTWQRYEIMSVICPRVRIYFGDERALSSDGVLDLYVVIRMLPGYVCNIHAYAYAGGKFYLTYRELYFFEVSCTRCDVLDWLCTPRKGSMFCCTSDRHLGAERSEGRFQSVMSNLT
jgi:hypothetical protein